MMLRAILFAVLVAACSSSTHPAPADEAPIGGSTTAIIEDPCFAGRGADRRRCIDFAEPHAWAFGAACIDVETHGPLSPGWPYIMNADGTRNPRPDFIAGCVSANPQPGERHPTIICCP